MEIIILFEGYSRFEDGNYKANCSCVLLKGTPNVIVDTMTPWDGDRLLEALHRHSITPDDVGYVICTHGHSDHTGCNYLFKKAKLIVGFSVSHRDTYFDSGFHSGNDYVINDAVRVVPTPGHTMQDVSVIVKTDEGVTAITGDLFEKYEDLEDCSIWKCAGSDCEKLQESNREKILRMADVIIPGHGKAFKVPENYKK